MSLDCIVVYTHAYKLGSSVKSIISGVHSDVYGQFDCIWDKNSFGAINVVDREK